MSRVYAIAFVMLAYIVAASLDQRSAPTDTPVVTAAQAAGTVEYMWDMDAAKACRIDHGEALLVRKADGSLVCVPRNSKRLAANP